LNNSSSIQNSNNNIHEYQNYGPLPYPNSYYPSPDAGDTTSAESIESESEEQSRPKFIPATWPETIPINQNPTNQSPTDKMTAKMPSRNHHSAPKFDGDPDSLSVFLGDIEQLAIDCELTPKQQIDWTIRYAPVAEQELWRLQPGVTTGTWATFKDDLQALYPGSSGDRKFSVANLELLTDKQATLPMENVIQFGEYYRAFAKVSTFLKSKGRITEREISNTFLKGLEYSFRLKVRNQLRAENPTHHTDDPWTIKQIATVALFVLSCGGDEFQSQGSEAQTSSQGAIKRETFDTTKLSFQKPFGESDLAMFAHEMVKQMNLQLGSQGNPELNTYKPFVKSNSCAFCSATSHFQKECPKAAEYISKNLCRRNSEGFITLSNGDRITRRIPGADIKERVDNWNKNNTQSTSVTSTNFFEVAEAKSQFVWIEEEPEKEERMVTQRDVEELQTLENLVASTQKRINETRGKVNAARNKPNTRSVVQPEAEERPQVPDKEQAKNSMPNKTHQYRYTTPIENERTIKKVAEQTMDTQVTLTTREILAIAPDVRKHIKEQITTKRTLNSDSATIANLGNLAESLSASTYMATLPVRQDNIVVAKHTEELRAIDVLIEGKVQMEAVVDDGSQIIGIRKDKWEELGIPIRSDHQMVMESANKTRDHTMGLLQDLVLEIGGYRFYLQVQVVENAPYELLLGRPFFTLTQAVTRHFTNGDSHITLVDPNTGAVITFPTRPRNREKPEQKKSDSQDF